MDEGTVLLPVQKTILCDILCLYTCHPEKSLMLSFAPFMVNEKHFGRFQQEK